MDAVNVPDLHRLSLGAYVLGALEAGERAELEAHLASCPACQEELVRLAGLPGLLRQLSLDEVLEATPDDEHDTADTSALAERALLGLRRDTRDRRSHTRMIMVSSAAAVVLGAVVSGALATGLVGEGWYGGTTVTATDAQTHVHASVRMKQETGGTELVLTLSGVPQRQRCLLVAVGRNGLRETAATWMATYQGEAKLEGYTSITPADMAALEILTPEGRSLVRLPVTV